MTASESLIQTSKRKSFSPDYGLPEMRLYAGKEKEKEGNGNNTRVVPQVSPRQAGCTLLWGVSSITCGLHGLEMVLPPDVTFQCHEASVEGEKRKSKRNLLASTVLLQNLATVEELSLQTHCPMHSLMIFISMKNTGSGCPGTALLCSSERGRNSWLLLCKAKYQ